jgi:hypothetical protein
VLEHIVRHALALGDPSGLIKHPVDTQVDVAWPFSSSAWESDEKLRGISGRTYTGSNDL